MTTRQLDDTPLLETGGVEVGTSFLNADQRGGTGPNGKPSYTSAQAGAQIDRTNSTFNFQPLGQAATVTYGFKSTAYNTDGTGPNGTGGFNRFNATQIAQAELSLQSWSDVANLTFVRVGSGTTGEAAYTDSATILFSNYTTGATGAAAFAYYPGSTANSSVSSDVFVNSTLGYESSPVYLGYGRQTFTHELGHAIGLSHPGDYNAGTGSPTYDNSAIYYEDSRQYSLMSYWAESNTGGNNAGLYAAAPLLDDISAVQRLYGANMSAFTGDTVFGFNSNTGRDYLTASSPSSALIFAAWDAGGTDTFDFSGYSQGGVIDLRQGFFSSVGGRVGNVTIAMGAVIENAIGGSGTETITGNAADNTLRGGGGNDVLIGGAGADTMYGGLGDDAFEVAQAGDVVIENPGEGTDTVYSYLNDYTLPANVERLELAGAAFIGRGNALDNTIVGTAGTNILIGGAGADTMIGGAGNDSYEVTDAGDQVVEAAGGGYDLVYDYLNRYVLPANVERVELYGAAVTAYGNALDNVMVGNALNNVLVGAGGADDMYGLGGDDAYEVTEAGDNVIEQAGQGTDTVYSYLAAYTLPANVERLELAGSALVGRGNGLDNVIVGTSGDNTLVGGAGNDTLIGGAGNDAYEVTEAGDIVIENPGEGADTVYSYLASYTLPTNVERLELVGSAVVGAGNGGNNTLIGTGGANYLNGGAGDDTLTGGGGTDVFYWLGPSAGRDVITDFAPGSGEVVNVAGAQFANYAAIQAAAAQVGSDVVITLNDATTLTLQNVLIGQLSSANFSFYSGPY